jgi:hypothetical protein
MSHWKLTLNSEIYMECASETDVDGIPCGCLEGCKTATRYMLVEANVHVLLKTLSLDG